MSELQVVYRSPSDLIPYINNAKKHESAQVDQLAASIKEFGFNNPILLDGENGVIAGHGRLQAAQKLGLDSVPVIELGHLTGPQKKAYILADNRLAEVNTSWDFDLVSAELEAIQLDGFDIELTGFDDGFILDEPEEGLTDEDEVPDAPDEPVTVLGDVWLMGDHRLMCGDSTSIDAVDGLMAGESWDTCVIDPPYEVESLYRDVIPPQRQGSRLCVFWDFKRFALAASAASDAGWQGLYEFVWDNVTSWYTPNRPLARHKTCGVFGDDPYFNFDAAIIEDGKVRQAKTVSNTRGKCNYKPLDVRSI